MSSSMQAYLASKYMSGPKANAILARTSDKPKKKKRKTATEASSSGTGFIHDDDGGWGREKKDSDDEDMKEAQLASDRSFKKTTKSNWEVVQPGDQIPEEATPKDEEPQVVEDDDQPVFRAGLMTADQLKKSMPKKKKPTKEEIDEAAAAAAQETVYRDASGRKIDTKAERAEAARKKREREELEAKKMEWGKGLVQREEEEKRRLELEKEKTRGMARYVDPVVADNGFPIHIVFLIVRYADDVDLNAEQKAQERWNDPAAAFLTNKKSKGPKKPEYQGPPPPPNRFGIKPGYRWDGVDRGNGFEKKYFQKQNERMRRGAEAYEYSVDDIVDYRNPVSFEALARYHSVQPHLTKLILLILTHHRSKPLSTPATFLGEGFALVPIDPGYTAKGGLSSGVKGVYLPPKTNGRLSSRFARDMARCQW
ncbi:Bud13 domain-containing protein [Rhizoctonia solani AG-1 IA]|uniref:Bud13 domain-containing protein n=1 Tax=Thanatephorus cucumeris (strain AG1-IA) TaxID=983506 RepID=L8WYU2_THACA|nr:Bud13 domain-containing protein [Rhizoctonia solani AG-1 IA]